MDEANAHFAITAQYSEAEMLASRNVLERAQRTGALLRESDALIADIASRIAAVRANLTDNFPNHLARNLLRATGIAVDNRKEKFVCYAGKEHSTRASRNRMVQAHARGRHETE